WHRPGTGARRDQGADRDPHRRHQRRRGSGDLEGARIRQTHFPADNARRGAQGGRVGQPGRGPPMSIFVDENTRVVYQGLTGSAGRFYGLRNREYGTKVVAGTNPRRAGTDVEGIPVFATVKEAVDKTGATASCIFVPAPGVESAVMEAAEAGISFIVVITEGVPAQDEARFFNRLREDFPQVRLLGPNCPGIISPGKCNIGITAGEIATPGGPVGIVSRS